MENELGLRDLCPGQVEVWPCRSSSSNLSPVTDGPLASFWAVPRVLSCCPHESAGAAGGYPRHRWGLGVWNLQNSGSPWCSVHTAFEGLPRVLRALPGLAGWGVSRTGFSFGEHAWETLAPTCGTGGWGAFGVGISGVRLELCDLGLVAWLL